LSGGEDVSRSEYRDANAKRLFKAMSDYMASQNAISFDYDTYLEVVTKQNQKLGARKFRHHDTEPP
jgi:hypothetical protein